MNEQNCVMVMQTLQIQPIRNLITALKDILTDVTITFTKEGMKIVNFDKTQTILVNVDLNAKNFEKFICVPDKIIICANTLHLFRVISTISNDDRLTIYIDNADYNDGIVSYLGFQYENKSVKKYSNQKLRLLDPDMEEMVIPPVDYTTIINLPSADFQNDVRNLYGITERVEIKSVGDDVIFSGEGTFASIRIVRSQSDGNMEFLQKPAQGRITQGYFSLKSLNHFIKCTPMCHHLEIYLGNDLPLIAKYDVAALGEIRLCLGQLPPV